MIFKLNGADFSGNNIGKIDFPIEISEFTKRAITASGSTMSTAKQNALEVFFRNVGAIGSSSDLWSKLTKVYLPFLGVDVTKSFVNYKGNTVDATPLVTDAEIVNGGFRIKGADGGTVISVPDSCKVDGVSIDWRDASVFVLNTEDFVFDGSRNMLLACLQDDGKNGEYMSITTPSDNRISIDASQFVDGVNQIITPSVSFSIYTAVANKQVIGFSSHDGDLNGIFYGGVTKRTASRNLDNATDATGMLYTGSLTSKVNKQLANGAIVIGKYMTLEEMAAFQTALIELAGNFIELVVVE